MTNSAPLPYSTIVRQQDTDRALDTLTVKLYPDEVKPKAVDIEGRCPRCNHSMQLREWLFVVAGVKEMTQEQLEQLSNLDDVDRSKGDEQFDLICACQEAHLHRPPDKKGCGARFRVRITWP